MKSCKRFMSIIGVVLVFMGFEPQISMFLEYLSSIVGISKENVCFLFGLFCFVSLCIINLVQAINGKRKKLKASEDYISDFERRFYGKVVSFKDLKQHALVSAPKTSNPSDKESKFLEAQRKMEARRKVAPPLKKRKVINIKPDKTSLKERAGGIRRAS